MGFWNGLTNAIDMVLEQSASDQGFEAGLNGEAPRVIFGAGRYKESYLESYRLGQEATKQKLMNAVTKKLEDL